MQRILTSALCCALMLLAQSALATPDAIAALIDSKSQTSATNKQDDALGSFMDDKQLLERLGDRASSLVNTSMGFLGMPYRLGGNGEQDGGVDCSGFVRAVYQRTLGKVLPRRAAEQADATKTIQKDELQPGDLVFFNTIPDPPGSEENPITTMAKNLFFTHTPKLYIKNTQADIAAQNDKVIEKAIDYLWTTYGIQ